MIRQKRCCNICLSHEASFEYLDLFPRGLVCSCLGAVGLHVNLTSGHSPNNLFHCCRQVSGAARVVYQ